MTEGFSRIDQELCTGCGNCTATCPADAISGERNKPQTLSEERCVSCGRCVQVCSAYDTVFQEHATSRAERLKQRGLPSDLSEPLFAAYNLCFLNDIRAALADPDRIVLAQCGPAVFGSLAEDFGLAAGSLSTGRIIAALKKIGIRKVYSLAFPAALAVLEQAHELADRLQSGRILPVINSSCPAAVKFIEQTHPELIHYFAGSKSPHQIAGALMKSYVAGILKVAPNRIYSISIGPCTSRKFEAGRPEMASEGNPHVDAVLTVRELAYLIKERGIDIASLPEESFDSELPPIPGMDSVYCSPGDVASAVVHVCRSLVAPDMQGDLQVKFADAGIEGARTASVQLNSYNVKVAAITGLPAAAPYIDAIKAGKNEIAFMELLACPAGCVSGGGQPKILLPQEKDKAYAERAALNPAPDGGSLSAIAGHPALIEMYQKYFGKPCGDKSNKTLQTQYEERKLSK